MSSVQSVQSGSSAAMMAAMAAQMQSAQNPQGAQAAPDPAQSGAGSEAQETRSQTRSEAAKGDQQAVQRLARLQGSDPAQQPEAAAAVPAQGDGSINVVA